MILELPRPISFFINYLLATSDFRFGVTLSGFLGTLTLFFKSLGLFSSGMFACRFIPFLNSPPSAIFAHVSSFIARSRLVNIPGMRAKTAIPAISQFR